MHKEWITNAKCNQTLIHDFSLDALVLNHQFEVWRFGERYFV